MKKILIISYIYVALSVIGGPAILVLDAHLFPRVACFDIDPVAARAGSQPPISETLSQYAHSQLFQTLSAGIMIIIGIILLVFLRKVSQKSSPGLRALSMFLIVCVILGYLLIITLATFLGVCVGSV